MNIKSLEEFDRETAAKRAELARALDLTSGLPTVGKFVEWIGENGWDEKGAPREPIAKRQELKPHILHGPCAYKEAEHVAFSFGDGGKHDGGGEPTGSEYRSAYVRAYLTALLDACEPFMLDVVAWRGQYAGYFHEGFDPSESKRLRPGDYDKAIARGRYLLDVDTHTGEHSYQSASLEFYISRPVPYKVSIDLARGSLYPWKLAAQPRYATQRGRYAENVRPDSWSFPHVPTAANVFKRASADGGYGSGARGYRLDYLFEKREYIEEALGLVEAPR